MAEPDKLPVAGGSNSNPWRELTEQGEKLNATIQATCEKIKVQREKMEKKTVGSKTKKKPRKKSSRKGTAMSREQLKNFNWEKELREIRELEAKNRAENPDLFKEDKPKIDITSDSYGWGFCVFLVIAFLAFYIFSGNAAIDLNENLVPLLRCLIPWAVICGAPIIIFVVLVIVWKVLTGTGHLIIGKPKKED